MRWLWDQRQGQRESIVQDAVGAGMLAIVWHTSIQGSSKHGANQFSQHPNGLFSMDG
jgi:hypothetical protein